MSALLIALGGAVGTLLRHGVNVWVAAAFGGGIGTATLVANLAGSFALGLVAETLGDRSLAGTDLRLIVGTGMLGGFTTYSTFNLVTLRLLQQGELARAAGYTGLTVLVCLVAGGLGLVAARSIQGS